MNDKADSDRVNSGTTREKRGVPPALAGGHFANHLESALSPLRAFLTFEQLETVRSVLRSSIETDPVSRVLAQGVARTHGAIMTTIALAGTRDTIVGAAQPRKHYIRK